MSVCVPDFQACAAAPNSHFRFDLSIKLYRKLPQFHIYIYTLASALQTYNLISWNILGSSMLHSDAVTLKGTRFTNLVESSVELTKRLYAMKQTSVSVYVTE